MHCSRDVIASSAILGGCVLRIHYVARSEPAACWSCSEAILNAIGLRCAVKSYRSLCQRSRCALSLSRCDEAGMQDAGMNCWASSQSRMPENAC